MEVPSVVIVAECGSVEAGNVMARMADVAARVANVMARVKDDVAVCVDRAIASTWPVE